MDDLTWTCHVCHEERPDERISVFSIMHNRGRVNFQENIRYCNDRSSCIENAPQRSLFGNA